MSRISWTSALTAVLVIASISAGWAQKVVVDPNAPGAQTTAVPKDDVDPRLAQKITYDSGYKRLHVVVEDLARLSEVSIACGSGTKDWRVRDIPLVVCVKDMPLGKLLRAVADATHTWIASPRSGDSKAPKAYRIYRRAREEAEIDSLLQSRHEVKIAQVNWQWDAMVAYGKSPEITDFRKEYAIFGKPLWPLAKLMATLGPDAKSQMLNGETFRFRGNDAASKDVINDLYQAAWNYMKDGMGEHGKTAPAPTRQDAEASELTIKLTDTGDTGETEIKYCLSPMVYGAVYSGWTGSLSHARALCDTTLRLPPYPEDAQTPSRTEDMLNPQMLRLYSNNSASWDYPLLTAQISVEKPEHLKDPAFVDAIRALSEASGCNIVVEDFLSHMPYRLQQMDFMFVKDTTVRDLLKRPISGGVLDYGWFFNESDKLLVGWCDDGGNRRWRDHHRNLVSEQFVTDLKRKLDGPGVALDDAVHLSTMPRQSFDEWVFHSKDFSCLSQVRSSDADAAWWKLYEALESADKATAKSSQGLPLAKLDPEWIMAASRAQKLMASGFVWGRSTSDEESRQRDTERKLKDRVMSDPKIIATMVMRIASTPASTRLVKIKTTDGNEAITGGVVPPELKLFSHSMAIDYKMDGRDAQMVIRGPNVPLPVWSAEREAEIIKAASAKASK